jgi:hypothetical protein
LTRASSSLFFAALSAAALGCGGDASPSGDSFTLHVSSGGANGKLPLVGASVAVDQGDGSRSEGSTGGDGVVTVPGIDLSKGPFSFTVAAAGYVAVSSLHHTKAGGWQITLSALASGDSGVPLTGMVRGKTDPDHFIEVSTTASSTTFSGIGPEYSIRVSGNDSMQAIVAEYGDGPAPKSAQGTSLTFFEWASFAVGRVSQPSVLDLVFPQAMPGATASIAGQSLLPLKASGTLLVPTVMLGARGGLRVSSQASDRTAFLGAAKRIDLATNVVDLDYEAEYVNPSGSSSLTTEYWIGLDGAYSYAFRDAPPGESVSLMSPPKMPSPLPLYGELFLSNPTPDAQAWIDIERDDRTIVWRVYGLVPGDARMPRLPSAIDPRTVLGTGRITARPQTCRLDTSGQRCSEVGLGAPADLVAP